MIIIKNSSSAKSLYKMGGIISGNYNYIGLFELGGDFDTFFKYDNEDSIFKPEIRKWCDDNIGYHYQDNKVMIFFKKEEDAMAFKMMWL